MRRTLRARRDAVSRRVAAVGAARWRLLHVRGVRRRRASATRRPRLPRRRRFAAGARRAGRCRPRRRRRAGCDGRRRPRRRRSRPGGERRAARGQHRRARLRVRARRPSTSCPGETVVLHVSTAASSPRGGHRRPGASRTRGRRPRRPSPDPPPGPTPLVSVPPEVGGLRIVVRSGAAGRRHLDRARGRRAARRGSWAATSRATGRRAWSVPVRFVARRDRADARPRRSAVADRGRSERAATVVRFDVPRRAA